MSQKAKSDPRASRDVRRASAPLRARVANALRAAPRFASSAGPLLAVLRWHPLRENGALSVSAPHRGGGAAGDTDPPGRDGSSRRWDGRGGDRQDCRRDLPTLLAEWTRLREASAALVETLRTDDLSRSGRHPQVGRLSVSDLLAEWVHHDRNHQRQILANVQAYVWPHIGNGQRFSLPEP